MKIDIWCGKCWEPFGPTTQDIGGSEKAVINMARELTAQGAQVTVYGEPVGEQDPAYGTWLPHDKWSSDHTGDLLVAWRTFVPYTQKRPNYTKTAVWLHDVMGGGTIPDEIAHCVDHVLVLSEFHKKNVVAASPNLKDRIYITSNGIDTSFYPDEFYKADNNYFYSSSPRRGLGKLLREWPAVRAVYPNAVLNVAYGFELSIKMCEATGRTHEAAVYKQLRYLADKTPGVINHGRLATPELAELQRSCVAWLYPPSDFEETYCITALEAQAARAWPISRLNGALEEVLHCRQEWKEPLTTLDVIKAFNGDDNITKIDENYRYAMTKTWHNVAKDWLENVCSRKV